MKMKTKLKHYFWNENVLKKSLVWRHPTDPI